MGSFYERNLLIPSSMSLKNSAAVAAAEAVRETAYGVPPGSSSARSGRADIGWWTMMGVGMSFWMLVAFPLF